MIEFKVDGECIEVPSFDLYDKPYIKVRCKHTSCDLYEEITVGIPRTMLKRITNEIQVGDHLKISGRIIPSNNVQTVLIAENIVSENY